MFSVPVFATGITATDGAADPATCDTNVLGTDTGSVNLRAEFTPENINLKWYNDNTLINVANASNSCTYDTPISLPANPTKPGYTFKGWKAIPGTRIEYIESTGIQYIDTGFKFTGDIVKYDLVYNLSSNASDQSLFGASDSNHNWTGIPYIYDANNMIFLGSWVNGNKIAVTTYHSLSLGNVVMFSLTANRVNNTYRVSDNGVARSGTFSGTVTNTCNIALFAHNMCGAGIAQRASYKNYGFKITQDGVLVRDMIPIKDYSGVPCMYDFVTKQIFYNSGTGDFIAGPDL